MPQERSYCVYIMTNKGNTTLYTGVTSHIEGRVLQHKQEQLVGCTKKYKLIKLVYYEKFDNVHDAIAQEKQIKAGSRKKKIKFIKSINPDWKDLSKKWYDEEE